MTNVTDLDANKAIARRFVDVFNRQDYAGMEALLHRDFVHNVPVVADDAPNELRPLQSKFLAGKKLPHWKPRLNREEALQSYKAMFTGQYRTSMQAGSEDRPALFKESVAGSRHMHVDVLSVTAEEDRVAVEATSKGYLNPTNDRLYNNFYYFLFRIKDGKIVLLKEYQDTLHCFDYVMD